MIHEDIGAFEAEIKAERAELARPGKPKPNLIPDAQPASMDLPETRKTASINDDVILKVARQNSLNALIRVLLRVIYSKGNHTKAKID